MSRYPGSYLILREKTGTEMIFSKSALLTDLKRSVPGALFCTDHLASVEGQKRISCPIDPRQCVISQTFYSHQIFLFF